MYEVDRLFATREDGVASAAVATSHTAKGIGIIV